MIGLLAVVSRKQRLELLEADSASSRRIVHHEKGGVSVVTENGWSKRKQTRRQGDPTDRGS